MSQTSVTLSQDLERTYALLNDLWALTHNHLEKFGASIEIDTREHLLLLHKRYGFPITASAVRARKNPGTRS